MFGGCGFSLEIMGAARLACTAGQLLSANTWARDVQLKSHEAFGTSSFTEADKGAQSFIIEGLKKEYPEAVIMGEEGEASKTSVETVLAAPLSFIIDPYDGTTEGVHDLPLWSVSIGVMKNGALIGGAISAPEIRGGLTVASENSAGVRLTEFNRITRRIDDKEPQHAKLVVQLGLDVQRLSAYHHFIGKLPKELKPRGVAPSGALGLALVALGRVDALVQSPQMPWDWCAGIPMCIEAGRKVRYYHIVNGKILAITAPEASSFRTDKQMLGFIVGKAEIVDAISVLLSEHYGE